MTFPLVKGLMAKANGVNEANTKASFDITRRALDDVAARTEGTGYLVGESFTAADLTAAALFAPIANPEHPDMKRPSPYPMKCSGCSTSSRTTRPSFGSIECIGNTGPTD